MILGTMHCPKHGECRAAFVCQHLLREASGKGFYVPNTLSPDGEGVDEQTAWCAECERVRAEQGGWNDASEAFAAPALICEHCFEAIRDRNELGDEVQC